MTTFQKITAFVGYTLLIAMLISGITYLTQQRIVTNQQHALQNALTQVLPADEYDNDITKDTLFITSHLLGSDQAQTIYRARKNGKVVAVIFTVIAPHGYNGAIKLLIGVRNNDQITGVRAIAHQETPGLGDKMEVRHSDWIYSFNNQSLQTLAPHEWAVKKDAGHFDAWTGATITPRAIVSAIHDALQYVAIHQHELFGNQEP